MANVKITEKPIAEDITNVFVNDNGKLRQATREQLMDILGIPHEHTVYGDTLTWDGDTEGKECAGPMLYLISDAIPKKEDFANGCEVVVLEYIHETGTTVISSTINVTQTDITQEENGVLHDTEGTFCIVPENNLEYEGIIFQQKGIYLVKVSADLSGSDRDTYTSSLTIPGYAGFPNTTTKKLEEKYLPPVDWDKVENKPFDIDWENPTVLVENQSITFDEGIAALDMDLLKIDRLYKIVYDSVEYIRHPFYGLAGMAGTCVAVGSLIGLGGDATGEPFGIASASYENITYIFQSSVDTEAHTVSVYEYKRLDKPYVFLNNPTFFFPFKGYLYKSVADAITGGGKVTQKELSEAMMGLVLLGGQYYVQYPIYIENGFDDDLSYGLLKTINHSTGDIETYYTAEYTPETT